jgi:hypothetical protein
MPKPARTIRPVDQRDIAILEALLGWSDPLPHAGVAQPKVADVRVPTHTFSHAA